MAISVSLGPAWLATLTMTTTSSGRRGQHAAGSSVSRRHRVSRRRVARRSVAGVKTTSGSPWSGSLGQQPVDARLQLRGDAGEGQARRPGAPGGRRRPSAARSRRHRQPISRPAVDRPRRRRLAPRSGSAIGGVLVFGLGQHLGVERGAWPAARRGCRRPRPGRRRAARPGRPG